MEERLGVMPGRIQSLAMDCLMHCVHKDEFLDHRAETAEMFHSINDLKIFKTKIE